MKNPLYPHATHIWIKTPTKEILSWDGPGAQMGVEGYFRCVLSEKDGTVVRDTDWFPNIITTAGFQRITTTGSTSNWYSHCEVGEGTGTPAVGDTTLFTPIVGITRPNRNFVDSDLTYDSHYWRRDRWRFEEGNGTGSLKELGLYTSSTGGVMWNHALIVDGVGSPTTIVKGAEQVLDVFYECRTYPVLTDQTGTFDLSGVSYDYTLRPCQLDANVFAYGWSSGAIERFNFGSSNIQAYTGGSLAARTADQPGGTQMTPTVSSDATHIPNSYYSGIQESTLPYYVDSLAEMGIDAWHGTIDCLRWETGNCCWQIEFEKTVGGGGIVKTDEQRLRLTGRAYVDRT